MIKRTNIDLGTPMVRCSEDRGRNKTGWSRIDDDGTIAPDFQNREPAFVEAVRQKPKNAINAGKPIGVLQNLVGKPLPGHPC